MNQADLYPEDVRASALAEFGKGPQLVEGSLPPLEMLIETGDGHHKTVEIRAAPVSFHDQLCLLGTFRDVSERKKSDELKDTLLREVHHRIKNNLTMISSLLSLKSDTTDPPVDLSDIIHRIDAICVVHDLLNKHGNIGFVNAGVYLSDLVNSLFSLSMSQVEATCSAPDIDVPTRDAINLGLIVNEVATNAMKYGFVTEKKERFDLDMRRTDGDHEWLLSMTNTGAPLSADLDLDASRGLGLRLVGALAHALSGTFELYRTPATKVTVTFRLDDVSDHRDS